MANFICPKCHYIGKPKRVKQGSTKMEVFAWMMFPLGVPYTFWRMLSKTNACKHCDNDILIDVESPTGKTLMARMDDVMVAGIAKSSPTPPAPPPDAPAPKPTRVDDGW